MLLLLLLLLDSKPPPANHYTPSLVLTITKLVKNRSLPPLSRHVCPTPIPVQSSRTYDMIEPSHGKGKEYIGLLGSSS